MAGMKINCRRKLPGSTLMEVVIAMVIIILVFGIAMMIYTNVTRLSLSARKVRAAAILQGLLLQANNRKDNRDRSIRVEEFRIEQKVTRFQHEPGLSEIELTAFGENQEQVAQLQQIISNESSTY
jgi:type II secretory pathway pseudopilin PulG